MCLAKKGLWLAHCQPKNSDIYIYIHIYSNLIFAKSKLPKHENSTFNVQIYLAS